MNGLFSWWLACYIYSLMVLRTSCCNSSTFFLSDSAKSTKKFFASTSSLNKFSFACSMSCRLCPLARFQLGAVGLFFLKCNIPLRLTMHRAFEWFGGESDVQMGWREVQLGWREVQVGGTDGGKYKHSLTSFPCIELGCEYIKLDGIIMNSNSLPSVSMWRTALYRVVYSCRKLQRAKFSQWNFEGQGWVQFYWNCVSMCVDRQFDDGWSQA